MRAITLLSIAVPLGILACTSEDTPTQPGTVDDQSTANPSLALSFSTWTGKAPLPGGWFGVSAGMAPNSAGQSLVYAFGGTDNMGGTGFGVSAYNVATNTWTRKLSAVGVFSSHGVGKIGNKLYFSGGYVEGGNLPDATNRLWAYDYTNDRMIRKADLPIFSAEGVTGVIDAKLYVLPGACNGNGYPNPGYCAEERTRRFYRYDPATNSWVARRQAPHFHRNGAAAVLNGKFYVAGGFRDFEPVADLDVYDPATNTWRTLAPLPTAGGGIGAAIGGKFFVIVGSGSGLRSYAYDPKTDIWKPRASPTWQHGAVVKVTLDGRTHLLAVGDSHGPDFDIPNDSELYTQ